MTARPMRWRNGCARTSARYTSANQQLGNVKGLISTTITGLNNVSSKMIQMRDKLVNLEDGNTSGDSRTQDVRSYKRAPLSVKTAIHGREL